MNAPLPEIVEAADPSIEETFPKSADVKWTNRFSELGPAFYSRLEAEPLPDPYWIGRSADCAALLGFEADWASRAGGEALEVFSGNRLWPGMQPLASVYSGHQFGVWAGQLGDGRALWLGELLTSSGPMELQLKGSGMTPYSRMGDGRAVLRSSIREFLCSEAMHGLGVPTTRALCVTGSTLPVRREEIETAAVVTRAAPSFIRFGHFEHFAHHGLVPELRLLADFVIEHHRPSCKEARNPYLALLEWVTLNTAELIARWQTVGFCHGVMNTDNMSILGLTLDYGPFGFLDRFDPRHICNHSDHQGRYAWGRQPQVALWNLHALAQALLPLIEDADAALAVLETYSGSFSRALRARWLEKLGLRQGEAGDVELIDDLLVRMAKDGCDFTLTFRRLATFSLATEARNASIRDLFIDRAAFDAWSLRYAERLRRQGGIADDASRALRMNGANPKYVLRNHLAEMAIQRAHEGDFSETQRLLHVLERPFDEHDRETSERYGGLPPDWAHSLEVSCSS